MRVRRIDGSRVTLSQPRIHGDTLYGCQHRGWVSQWISVPLTEVAALETHHTDPAKTALAVLALGAVAAVTIAAIQLSKDPFFNR